MIKYDYTIDRKNPNYAANKILSFIEPGGEVLDVGCSSGYLAHILRDEFHCRVTGLEIDGEAAVKAESFCEKVIVADVEKVDIAAFGDRRFDAIILADVLEHLRNPGDVLRKIAPLLKKDGFIVVSIPNFGYKGVLLGLAAGALQRTSHGILDDTHVQFFTLPGIFQLLSACNLVPVALDRTIKGVADSEFASQRFDVPAEIAELIDLGAEVDTYQFIVKVRPLSADVCEQAARFFASMVLQHGALRKELHADRKHFQRILAEKNRLIEQRNEAMAGKNAKIDMQQQAIAGKNLFIQERDQVIAGKNAKIDMQQQVIAGKNLLIQERDEVIARKNELIKAKNETIDRLTAELNRHWSVRVLKALGKKTAG
ncbi:MAG: methyltransferase domain-containing protein [Deltaproteobacteria bacterium]|nr:methyltransferase domain-containing protein [Deltaproteobacteria bacterium]